MERYVQRIVCLVLTTLVLLFATETRAQNVGFTLNRYEPTPAGEWSFLIDHPWYSQTRYFAGGLTLNYAHAPLVYGKLKADGTFEKTDAVINHQLLLHVDLAGSFLDRFTIHATLPIVLLERGNELLGIRPLTGAGVSDPRLGLMARLFGQPDESKISLQAGLAVWIPLRAITDSLSPQLSDQGARVLPKLVLAGRHDWLRWSALLGFLYRPEAYLGDLGNVPGSSVGSELQLGGSVQYTDRGRTWAFGPEVLLSTVVAGGHAFQRDFTSLDLLMGAHLRFLSQFQAGLALGIGTLRTPGTPDFRVLLRLAWAPVRSYTGKPDRDGDGVPDDEDMCPATPGEKTKNPRNNGCPPGDLDGDRVADTQDKCPDEPAGPHPDPDRAGCPLSDRDKDGVPDLMDICPDEPMGNRPDVQRQGCPMPDRDKDGVADVDDLCPEVPMGARPDPEKKGCPVGDLDKDGIVNPDDLCVDVPQGLHPDPARIGCPLPDRDKDNVVDSQDACPDKAGAPSLDPKKNGCPGLLEIKDGQLRIMKPVYFATDKDVILQKSFPVLQAVAEALKADTAILRVAIEGHTDSQGSVTHNIDLSDRRAKSVMKWLTIKGGINPERLSAKGYGPTRPIADNKSPAGRAANRRVEFHIIDPAPASSKTPAQ